MEIREVEHGKLWVNEGFEKTLSEAGLLSFDKLLGATGTKVTRDWPGKRRTTIRLEVGGRVFYLKRHERLSLGARLWPWLRGRSKTPAREEWENIFRLNELGIATMEPVAFGEDGRTGRSFTVTEELKGGRPLDEFVRELGFAERRRIAGQLGEMVRRFHGAGLTHRDLYLCHVFAVRGAEDRVALHMIDLQRVGKRGQRMRRWRVKDIAQLEYSRPEGATTRTDGARFLRAYFGERRLGTWEKRFVRSVMRKVASIRRHDMKLKERN